MVRVEDLMTKDVITVSPETRITEAAQLLLEKGINGVPVVDEQGKLVGILTQSDLVTQQKRLPIPSLFTLLDGFIPLTSTRHLEKEVQKITATTVAEAMTPDPVTVRPDTSLEDLANLMVDRKFHTIPVVDQGHLIGIVGKEDVLRTILSGVQEG
ncbi:MAG: CBS domain-containing protein [Deltaproteobacteria bacterium]|nr:CBS domain-containing protein [Deltaproteobacteria bacterium]